MLAESPDRTERTYRPEDADDRRALVKRIVASSSFARSNRLSDFLQYVCTLAEKGRFDDIHEQSIGSSVFGRMRGYDPGVDSIVRSHASRLRHRLKQYFEQEGRYEQLILTIPRGSYVPVFELRSVAKEVTENQPMRAKLGPVEGDFSGEPAQLPASMPEASLEGQDTEVGILKVKQRLRIALSAIGVLILLLLLLLWLRPPAVSQSRAEDVANRNPLWRQFLAGSTTRTIVVSSDSGLVMYQHLTGRSVSLGSYMSGEYLKHLSSESVSEDVVRKFGTRRYTPAVDLSVLDRMTRIFGEDRDRLSAHFARDLRLEDLKQGNAILLGSSESNPWVQLFEPSMNFLFQDDLLNDKSQMLNRHPAPGEALHYDSTPQEATPTVYGVVAYRHNLQASGHVLILEGQTMAGTQAAVDFVFDESYLLPFLRKVTRPDGSLPNFELLLRSSSFGGQSSRIELMAYRIQKD